MFFSMKGGYVQPLAAILLTIFLGATMSAVHADENATVRQVVGGPSPLASDLAQKYASVALQSAPGMNGAHTAIENIEIDHATKQLVAGMLYKIQARVHFGTTEETCNFSIWSRPWLRTSRVTKKCDSDPQEIKYAARLVEEHPADAVNESSE